MTDSIFGNLLDFENRLARYSDNLNGVKHLHRRSPLDPIPDQPILLTMTTGGPVPYDSARCLFTVDGSAPSRDNGQAVAFSAIASDWDDPTLGIVRKWQAVIPAQPAGTLLRYMLAAHRTDTDEWIFADSNSINEMDATRFSLWIDHDSAPAWAREAVIYQIFPERFNPGKGRSWKTTKDLSDFFGGTLQGITEKLDYIRSLGFNTIWINPFFKTGSHHGYNASDYYQVEPRLGTNADLQELIDQAHARGLRLILDFVANHWSQDHPTFQDAHRDRTSPYHDWYIWTHWPDTYECYFNVRELPKINLAHAPAREYMLDVARHWLQMGFDGYRLDFAYGPTHDFWVDFRRACREIKPDCWIFGEVVHTPEMLRSYTGIMDGTLDFPLARLLRETFAFEHMNLTEFEAGLAALESFYPPEYSRPSFLDNHDEARFLHIAGNNKGRLRIAALILFTLAGPPIVYYGTETGLSQERPMRQGERNIFEEARLPMNWESADVELTDYFRRLAELRKAHPALVNGTRKLLHLDDAKGIYAYQITNGNDGVIVAINRSPRSTRIQIRLADFSPRVDRLKGLRVEIADGELALELGPYSGAFLSE